MDYQAFFTHSLSHLKQEGRYRIFIDLERSCGKFPHAVHHTKAGPEEILLWCGNDYLGLGQHPKILEAMTTMLAKTGAGAGGTRNISGTTHSHVMLEKELADFHQKESALIFTSGYVANETTLATLAHFLPNCLILSDEKNHASIIHGIRNSRAEKKIFKHNDVSDLEAHLKSVDRSRPKLVVFESVYSMDGDISPIKEMAELAKAYNALTFLDEVHGIGLYGERGAGVAEHLGVADQIDIIQGTFGKAVGLIGGYITGKAALVDFVRSHAPGFIFTTSLPPAICEGVRASLNIIQNHPEMRHHLHSVSSYLKQKLRAQGLPVMESTSHIVPLLVGDAKLCKHLSDELLKNYKIYVQPINYPTVAKGQERLRFTPSALHTKAMVDDLVKALAEIWQAFKAIAA